MNLEKNQQYLDKIQSQLLKALQHLSYSYEKVLLLPTDPKKLDEESLETWESFSARFSRVVDIFLMRVLKAQIKFADPGFDGTLRDYLNQAEKMNLITNATEWLMLRELRNIAAHEYTDKGLALFLEQLRSACPKLLDLKK
jgi:hypothetical protein